MAEYKRVELNADDVIGEAAKSFVEYVAEARKVAFQEQIKANTILIDEKFAKVNNLRFIWGRTIMDLPPMICGLEIRLTDELPDGYNFALIEVPETERELIVKQAKAEVAREIVAEIDKIITDDLINRKLAGRGLSYIVKNGEENLEQRLAELKKKYTEGTYNSNSNELDILKSTITHKEEEAYNKGYADAKADILEKLQADIARDEILAEYGDEFFEGRIAGFKAVINYLKAESDT